MNGNKLFNFRTPTSNKDYLSLYRWVKSSNNVNNTINLKDSMTGILSKIADHRVIQMNKDKNQLSSQENVECNALYLELLETVSDVFTKMPSYILSQLPGYTKPLENDIKNAISKLQILQNNDIASKTKTREIINNCNIELTTGNQFNETTHLNDVINSHDNILLERENVIEEPNGVTNANNYTETVNIDNDDVSEVYHLPSTFIANRRHSHTELRQEPHSVTNNVNTYFETINIDEDNVPEVNHLPSTSYAIRRHSRIDHSREPHSVTNNVNTYLETINIDKDNVSEANHLPSTSYANRRHSHIEPRQEPHSVTNNVNIYLETINFNKDNVSEANHFPSTLYDNRRHSHIEPRQEPHSVTNNVNTYLEKINIDKDNVSEAKHLPSTSYANRRHSHIEHRQGPHSVMNNVNTYLETMDIDKDNVSEVNHLPSTSYANMRHGHIEPSRDQITHCSSNLNAENTEPDTNYRKTIDNSVFSKDSIYPRLMLKSNFRLQNFRENQLEAINAARFRHNCFIVMPPRGGKSLCYQMPAILSSGVTIVVSPLSSLILDEIEQLKSLKIIDKVAHLEGKLGNRQETFIFKKLSKEEPAIKLLYITPEKLMISELVDILNSLHEKDLLTRFVIDEAQCVLQWDVGFRGAYSKLHELCTKFDTVPVTALTSCATKSTMKDIQIQLGMTDSIIFCTSLNLPNISYNISKKDEINSINEHVAMLIHDKYKNQSGILYCLTNDKCKEMAKILKEKGVTAIACLSNMNEKAKRNAESYWLSNNCNVICTTNSYGITINKPDVRFIVHYSLPPSIESYYQGTSRAGRDGSNAECYLFYSPKDIQTNILTEWNNFEKSDPNYQIIKESRQRQLMEMYDFCTNEHKCRRLALLEYFNNKYSNYDCGEHNACDYCRNQIEKVHFDEEYPLLL